MPPAPLGEFELIARYFARPLPAGRSDVSLGIGDDCALLRPSATEDWAVSTDTLIEGVHFLPSVDPSALGHKALAVNLSDLAACGAEPRCFLLALALPRADPDWLEPFANGLLALADEHRCVLVGGDTTRSPAGVAITITVFGAVIRGHALRRSGAAAGDDLWVSGTLGDAAFALALRRGEASGDGVGAETMDRLDRPLPRVALGLALRGVASAAIDVSDGLLGDLGHLMERSSVGAEVRWGDVPRSAPVRHRPEAEQCRWALAGGDDYELLFTASRDQRAEVEKAAAGAGVIVSRIGAMTSTGRLVVVDADGGSMDTAPLGYDHFRG